MPQTTVVSTQADSRDVARELIRYIQTGGLSAGDRLPSIRQLAEQFQSSASVIRDALMQAQTMGLVKILPRSGAFVQAVNYSPLVNALAETFEGALLQTDPNLFHLLESRQLVEVASAAQAAQRRRLEDLLPVRESLDRMDHALGRMHSEDSDQARKEFMEADIQFHLQIAEIAGNPVLVTMLQALLGLLRPHLAQIPWSAERKEITRQAHIDLYEALLEGEANRAELFMKQHLKMAYDGLLKKVWSKPKRAPLSIENGHGEAEGT